MVGRCGAVGRARAGGTGEAVVAGGDVALVPVGTVYPVEDDRPRHAGAQQTAQPVAAVVDDRLELVVDRRAAVLRRLPALPWGLLLDQAADAVVKLTNKVALAARQDPGDDDVGVLAHAAPGMVMPLRLRPGAAEAVVGLLRADAVRGAELLHRASDNGPESTARAVREWLGRVGARTLNIEPGSPWENGYIESFNGKLRDELPDKEIFYTLLDGVC